MRILFLSPRQCLPSRSGARIREYHFLRALSRAGEVDYAYFADPNSDPLSTAELNFCRNIVSVSKPRAYTIRQKLLGVIGKWPLPILNYSSSTMMQAVHDLTTSNDYDLIHLDSIHMLRYAENVTAPVIYNWHNIESEAFRRYANTVRDGVRSTYARITASKMERLERKILLTRFGHIVCSEREQLQLSSIAPTAKIAVVENGVDTKFFDMSRKSTPGDLKNLVFVGTMDYYPNIDAAVSFATTIWPLVRDRIRDLRFVIVGANPTHEIKNLSRIPGVSVTNTVRDVRPYYQEALAAIVPIRTGGGTRLKILEAMAAGIPVISTPLGAEGLKVNPDIDILFAEADRAESWFGQISRLIQATELRVLLSANALALVNARYDWDILGGKLSQTYQQWLNEKPLSPALRRPQCR